MTEPNGGRITVSEDKLDAKLARLELSLIDRITKELVQKADAAVVSDLRNTVATMQSVMQTLIHLPAMVADQGKQINALQEIVAGNRAVSAAQKFWFGTVGVGILAAVSTLVWLAIR